MLIQVRDFSLRKHAVRTENGDYQSLWVGVEFEKARALPVAKIISELVSEMCDV